MKHTKESQLVGPDFDKEHKHIKENIERLIKDLKKLDIEPDDFFQEATFKNDRGNEYDNYKITEEGYLLLALTLQGVKATAFKVEFIRGIDGNNKC